VAPAAAPAAMEEAGSFLKPNLSRRSQHWRRPYCPSMHNG
jgi:hypothetical protein